MKKGSIKPLGKNVLIKLEASDQKTDSGIILPDNASQERPQEGKIIEIGDSKDIKVKKNQKVIFNRYGGTEIKMGKETYLVIKSEDILAVIG